MKEILAGVVAALNAIENNYQVRDEGLVSFRMQKVALQQLIDAPDTAPATVVQTVIADGKLDNLVARLTNVESALIQVVAQTTPAPATPAAPAAPAIPAAGAGNPPL